MFFSDLCRAVDPVPDGCEVHFVRASSYEGKTTESNHSVKLTFLGLDASQLRDRHVIVVSPRPFLPSRTSIPVATRVARSVAEVVEGKEARIKVLRG